MTRLLRCLLVVVFAVPLTWLTPAPAHACSCVAPPPLAVAVNEAEAVFVVTLDEPLAESPGRGNLRGTATVDRVLVGDVPDKVTVTTSNSSCGVFGLGAGDRWLFITAAAEDDTYDIGGCGSSGPANDRRVERLAAALGVDDPAAPGPSGTPSTDVVDSPDADEPEADPADEGAGDENQWATWLVGLGIGLAVVVGGVVLRNRRRAS